MGAACVPELLRQFGRTVAYRDERRNPVTLTAIVGDTHTREELDEAGFTVTEHTCEEKISTDPDADTGGVADPGEHAQVKIGDDTGDIEAVDTMADSLAVLHCVRKPLVSTRRRVAR